MTSLAVQQTLRVLIVEDRPFDAELLATTLEGAGYRVTWSRVENESGYLSALDTAPDLILSDYSLPHFSGLRALALLQQRGLDIPFIIVSGTIDDEQAVSVMRAGADDYLLKDRLARLGAAVATVCEKNQLRSAKQRAEERLCESSLQLRAFLDNSPALMFIKDSSGRYLQINQRFAEAFGLDAAQIMGRHDTEIFDAGQAAQFKANDHAVLQAGKPVEFEETARYRDGFHTSIVTKFPLRDGQGKIYGLGGIATDITARKLEEKRFQATFEQAAVGIVHTSLDRRYLAVNQKFCAMVGYSRDELLGKDTADITHPEDRVEDGAHRNRLLAGEIQTYTAEKRYVRKDGSVFSVHRTISLARDSAGQPQYFIRVIEDITERRRSEQAQRDIDEKFRQLANHIPQIFWMTDIEQKSLIYASPAYEQITGRTLAELQSDPRGWIEIIHEHDRERVKNARKTRAASGDYDIEYRLVRTDHSIRWIHDRAFPVRNAKGEAYRIAGIAEDITERKLTQEQLANLAHYDSLTGLPNRVLFNDRLRQAVAQARRNQWILGVLFLDLDRFKLVNDTLGHATGDLLLKQVAARLFQCLRPTDTVGRLSGDEFAVILSELAETQNAGYVAQKILDTLSAPFDLKGSEVFVTASIGITLYPSDSESIDTLIRDADAAMYSAKAAGRNNYQYYTAVMNERALEKLRLETGIRRALERNELLLHYQPKIDISSGRISGLEALLRWQSPEHGLVSPAQFIPLLEETGLIVPVGEWVTRAACAQLQAWRKAGVTAVPVAINLSARQLRQQGYATVLEQALKDFDINPELIRVEITESSLMENPEEAIVVLQSLKALGIRLDADDFGTGYSSLSYLKRFPLDALKIDRSFVRDITSDEDDAVIAQTMVTLAHSLGLKVVAEGVETEAQLAFLGAHQCDEAQGYLFAKPLDIDSCTELLATGLPLRQKQATGTVERAPTILLVDDNARDLELTRLALQRDGHGILSASGSHEAFKLLAINRVGIVISDQNMPEMTGVEFLRQVKLMYPEVVRIMLSGTEDFSTAAAAINEGEVHKFFVKGQDTELLRREIKRKIWRAPDRDTPVLSTAQRHPGRPQRRLTTR